MTPVLRWFAPPRTDPLNGITLLAPGDAAAIPVRVTVRSTARRLILRYDRKAETGMLTAPPGLPRREIERFLRDHAGWLAARQRQAPARIRFEEGAIIPVLGREHRLVHGGALRGTAGRFESEGGPVLRVFGPRENFENRVLAHLKALALEECRREARRHAETLGVSLGEIRVKEMRSRWGSCSAKGDLSFAWRLVLAPPEILSYLAAHEVAHRREMNHSSRFWRVVRSLDPDYTHAENWLNRHGARLHLYGP